MKIIYISNSFIPSRTANSIHVMKMCQAFVDNGHEVVLLAPDYSDQYEEGIKNTFEYYDVKDNFKIIKLSTPNIKGKSIFYLFSILKYLLFNKADLVYGRFIHGCYISALMGFKTIYESHAPVETYKTLEVQLFNRLIKNKNLIKLVVISKALKNIYLKDGYLNSERIQVAHDGADKVKDFNLKIELFGNSKNLNVGYVGHLYPGRGIEIVIELAKNIEYMNFHIVGGTESDIKYWLAYVEEKKLTNIFLYGHVSPEKAAKYRNSFDIVLAPYAKKVTISKGTVDTSSFMSPLKIFEYMAHKKPIIVSDLPVLREVLTESNAILVDAENKEEWIEALKKLEDKRVREQISMQAYKDFESFTWLYRVESILKNIHSVKSS